MSIAQRDYLMRLIEQFAQFLAALLGKKESGRLDEASEMIEQALDVLLGPMRRSIEQLDAASVAMLLADKDKLRVYARLLLEQASIDRQRGRDDAARRLDRRSADLVAELRRRYPDIRE